MADDMDRVRAAIQARKEMHAQEEIAAEKRKKESEQRAVRRGQQLAKWRQDVRPMISAAIIAVSNDAAREGSEFLIAEVPHGREAENIAFIVHQSGKSIRFPAATLLIKLDSDGLVRAESAAKVQMPAPVPLDTVGQEWARSAGIAVLLHAIDPSMSIPDDDEGSAFRVRERR
jgi:hypothetical protein